jgi:hypothetical protein
MCERLPPGPVSGSLPAYTMARHWQACATGRSGRRTAPHETPAEVVAKIIYLRTNYHFGHRRPHPHPGRLDSTEGRNGLRKLAKILGSGIDLISSGRN